MSHSNRFKVAVVWRGDRQARLEARAETSRLNAIFEALEPQGIAAEPAVWSGAMTGGVRGHVRRKDGVRVGGGREAGGVGLEPVTGRANAGKTGVGYDVWRAAAASGRRPAQRLPTYPDVVRATAELSRSHPLGAHVEQLDRWIEGLWSLLGDGRRAVTPEQRPLLVPEAIAGTRLRALARSAGTPGFVRLISYVAPRAADEPRSPLDDARSGPAADTALIAILRPYRTLLAASGWGISPKTLPVLFMTPAMARAEPLRLAASVTLPAASL